MTDLIARLDASSPPHIPVMLTEALQALAPQDGGFYVDCTFGAGGYSRALLNACACRVAAADRDPEVVPLAQAMQQEYGERFRFLPGEFAHVDHLVRGAYGDDIKADGVVLDVGVSSMQLDDGSRGFSFQKEAPLDMRMSRDGYGAREAVNELDEATLADVIFYYGGERKARAVASRIVRARKEGPIETTSQLAKLVHSCFPRRSGSIDNATRTFQALRIYVNDELGQLESAMSAAWRLLKPGGILAAVTFHSLEDAIVKRFMLSLSSSLPPPGYSSASDSGLTPETGTGEKLTKKPVTPSDQEVAVNPRARSAKLRAARKLKECDEKIAKFK